MKKPNKKLQATRQKNAEKKAARKKARKQQVQERLNHKKNVIEAKRQEIMKKYLEVISAEFEKSGKK